MLLNNQSNKEPQKIELQDLLLENIVHNGLDKFIFQLYLIRFDAFIGIIITFHIKIFLYTLIFPRYVNIIKSYFASQITESHSQKFCEREIFSNVNIHTCLHSSIHIKSFLVDEKRKMRKLEFPVSLDSQRQYRKSME